MVGNGSVLLLRRNRPPHVGSWDLPGGFCEPSETLEQALAREFLEETGLQVLRMRYIASHADTYDSTSSVIQHRKTVNVSFEVEAESGRRPRASPEGPVAFWPLTSLPVLAFPASTGAVLQYLIDKRKAAGT
jgi:8-oxo-dGTP diphosphatase